MGITLLQEIMIKEHYFKKCQICCTPLIEFIYRSCHFLFDVVVYEFEAFSLIIVPV